MCLSSMSLWDQQQNHERATHHPSHHRNRQQQMQSEFGVSTCTSADSMSDSTSTTTNHMSWQMSTFKDAAYFQATNATPFPYPYPRHSTSPGEVFSYGGGGPAHSQIRCEGIIGESGNFCGTTSGLETSSWQPGYQAKSEPPDYATVAATMAAAAVCRQAQYFEDLYSRKKSGKNKGRL